MHDKAYKHSVKHIEEKKNDLSSIEKVIKRMKNKRIPIFKYNYSLDVSIQNSAGFEGYLQLSEDEETLLIFNKKPIDGSNYILEADPDELKD